MDATQVIGIIVLIVIFVLLPILIVYENKQEERNRELANKKRIAKQKEQEEKQREEISKRQEEIFKRQEEIFKQKEEDRLKREAQELIDAAEKLENIRKNGIRNTVYAVYDKISYNIYIGKTSDYNFRMSQHFDEEYRYSQKNKKLYIEMEKLGENNFEHIILATNLQANYATYLEAKLIRANNSDTKGYNQKNESENLWYGPKLKVENPKAYQRFEELCKLDISSEIKNGTFKTIVLDK